MASLINQMPDLMFTSIEEVHVFGIDGTYRFTLDELQNASLSQSQEESDIVGKQGRKLNTIKKNKSVTVSGTNGLVSSGLLEVQTGGKFAKGSMTLKAFDYLTVQSNKATTTFKAIGTTGSEIGTVYVKDSSTGLVTKELEQAATAASGKFAYSPTTNEITFNSAEVADGTEIVVFYEHSVTNAFTLDNDSETYSEKVKLYVDALAEDKCGNVYHVQYYFPKADMSGEVTLDIGDNQTVHNFEARALSGACGGASTYYTMTIFGVSAS